MGTVQDQLCCRASLLRKALPTPPDGCIQQILVLYVSAAILGLVDDAVDCGAVDRRGLLTQHLEHLLETLIVARHAVDYYEVTRYGSLIAWPKRLGRSNVAKALEKTLKEEKAVDKKLTTIAGSKANLKAALGYSTADAASSGCSAEQIPGSRREPSAPVASLCALLHLRYAACIAPEWIGRPWLIHGGYQHRFLHRGDWTLDSGRRGSESDGSC